MTGAFSFNDRLSEDSNPRFLRDPRFDYNHGLRCNFTGCYELPNGTTFLLDSSSCYIGIAKACHALMQQNIYSSILKDFNECSGNSTNGCDENADCTNDDAGTYDCACHNEFIGNGFICGKLLAKQRNSKHSLILSLTFSTWLIGCFFLSDPSSDRRDYWWSGCPE